LTDKEALEKVDELEADISTLEGVGPATKQKLNNAGIWTIMDLLIHSTGNLVDILGGTRDKSLKLQEKARKRVAEYGILSQDFVSADKLYDKRQKLAYISLGSRNLDELLVGGIETQGITEFYGEFGTGKTQICHALAVHVQLPPEEGGLSAPAIYLDTEKTFRPNRIVNIAESRGLDPAKVLKNVHVARAMNSSHLLLLVRNVGRKIQESGARLVCMDSAVGPFRAEYVGRGQLAERQQMLNVMMHDLTRMAELYDVAIVLTNQVLSAPDIFFGDPTRPIGGHVVAHAVTYRLYLRKSRNARVAAIKDSPHHPPGEALFVINEGGIGDPD
jgi:DNA repair protein RadA